jgi:DNA-binding PadR family transcriptional regulator
MMYGPVHGNGDVSGLSTKHVVLGLLIERPGYGYDLIKRVRTRFGYLGLSESFVYRTLERLETEGCIEDIGEKAIGGTRRGAPRVRYRATAVGRQQFKDWMTTPSQRAVVRDTLQAKLGLSEPDDLPELLAQAEAQAADCVAELAALRRPAFVQVAESEVPWHHAAVMMVDDLNVRLLQALADWLASICELIEERIERASEAARSSSR